jgi:hypothetical protein
MIQPIFSKSLAVINRIDAGYSERSIIEPIDKYSVDYPPLPDFKPIGTQAERQKAFGKFRYTVEPNGTVTILDNWTKLNISTVEIPQLSGVLKNPVIWFHKNYLDRVATLFQLWGDAGLSDRIIQWGGSFVPRFVRGSVTVLSNHSWGTAFDINVQENYMGQIPALVGQKGCVRELVEIANKEGWFWGGFFQRKDGMHFEIAKL